MGAVKEAFENLGNKIKDACEAMVNTLKNLSEKLVGLLKSIIETTMSIVKALATGNMKELGEQLLKLAEELKSVVELPGDALQALVKTAVQSALQLVAGTLGFADKPWMKDVMNAVSLASNFTSLGSAAKFMGEEALAMATGQPSSLEETFHANIRGDIHLGSLANVSQDAEIKVSG